LITLISNNSLFFITGEEVINPQKAIPISILFSLLVCAGCYIGLSTVLTLMVPYYSLDANAPLPHAFVSIGYPVATWFVAVGALASFLTWLDAFIQDASICITFSVFFRNS
jgi:amino acid transporter